LLRTRQDDKGLARGFLRWREGERENGGREGGSIKNQEEEAKGDVETHPSLPSSLLLTFPQRLPACS
jgi:hypothetical protein